jgi:hypothetical protein
MNLSPPGADLATPMPADATPPKRPTQTGREAYLGALPALLASGQSRSFGQGLDWDASRVPVKVVIELPFWLMVDDTDLQVKADGCIFGVEVRSSLGQLHLGGTYYDSWASVVYVGPRKEPDQHSEAIRACFAEGEAVTWRKSKTVLRIRSACKGSVLEPPADGSMPVVGREKAEFLKAFVKGHLPVVNAVIRAYRAETYDYFAFEVSPYDVPVCFVEGQGTAVRVPLFAYVDWDEKPLVFESLQDVFKPSQSSPEVYRLTTPAELAQALHYSPTAGELELLDALNRIERGDYSAAIRRVTTAIEVVLEDALRVELSKKHPAAVVEAKLQASQNDFNGRLRQWEKLSSRRLSPVLASELGRIREKRHKIVHEGLRIEYSQRGVARRTVDAGRWIYNWIENEPLRLQRREGRIGKRSLGRDLAAFEARIGPSGVDVLRPPVGRRLRMTDAGGRTISADVSARARGLRAKRSCAIRTACEVQAAALCTRISFAISSIA